MNNNMMQMPGMSPLTDEVAVLKPATETKAPENPGQQLTTEQMLSRIVQLKGILDGNKPLYEELDSLVVQLKDRLGTDKEVIFAGKAITVVDNFAEKNTVFRPCGVKRFDLDMEDLAEREAKAAKKAAKGKK